MVGGNRLLRSLGLGASLEGFFSICFSSFLLALHHFRLTGCLCSDRQEGKRWAKMLTLSILTALVLLCFVLLFLGFFLSQYFTF